MGVVVGPHAAVKGHRPATRAARGGPGRVLRAVLRAGGVLPGSSQPPRGCFEEIKPQGCPGVATEDFSFTVTHNIGRSPARQRKRASYTTRTRGTSPGLSWPSPQLSCTPLARAQRAAPPALIQWLITKSSVNKKNHGQVAAARGCRRALWLSPLGEPRPAGAGASDSPCARCPHEPAPTTRTHTPACTLTNTFA